MGGFYLLNEEEMRFIVDNLFVGNRLASGVMVTSGGRRIDLRNIRSPIVVFASWGDNITPPQQALNWILDCYAREREIVAHQQTIVYILHQDIGHLGIFVSSRIAQREHTEIVQALDVIETLPPGFWEMVIDDKQPGTCAMRGGHSVDSTMGFTALDGLPMGTRSGQLDPGVVLYLLSQKGWSVKEVEHLLYRDAGLRGLSGIGNDVRDLLASDAPGARLALDYFVYRVGRELGSLAGARGGIDALVLTAGIGENSPEIRARIGAGAEWLGVRLDETANRAGGPRISAADSRVSA